ncbi:MAG TPA: hypothetical protein VMB20_10935 [Candidatus Acidoferrum sp.]|nr:hypothetical protein [Candidatus Acidoferrum sp.]
MAKLRTRDGLAELQSAVWILHGSLDPLATLATCSQMPNAQDGFALRLRGGARTAPIEARFHFIPENLHLQSLAFSWTHDDDVPLPSMSGTISARRIGPLVILRVHAHYACGLDVPERLFFEAVGCKLAEKTFAGLRRALVYLLQHLPSRSMHEA